MNTKTSDVTEVLNPTCKILTRAKLRGKLQYTGAQG